jgi:hypothetical protein
MAIAHRLVLGIGGDNDVDFHADCRRKNVELKTALNRFDGRLTTRKKRGLEMPRKARRLLRREDRRRRRYRL